MLCVGQMEQRCIPLYSVTHCQVHGSWPAWIAQYKVTTGETNDRLQTAAMQGIRPCVCQAPSFLVTHFVTLVQAYDTVKLLWMRA